MKKLLVTAIGAAAALSASAGFISTQRFETASLGVTGISSLNTLAGGNYWSGDELTNTYEIVSCAGEGFEPEEMLLGTPTKALSMKTTFGSPLKLDAIAGGSSSTNIPASGLYFDSLVKFTVCEEEPEQTYDGAKIIMWLQEQTDGNDNITGTNIMVRANYINADGTFTPTNFVCGSFSGSIDKWQRVTIKTWANILNGGAVPGFAIFINGEVIGSTSGPTMADVIKANLTEAPAYLSGNESVVFASLDQDAVLGTKGNISSVSFDGTGKLTDLVFTDEAPFDAAKDHVEPQAMVSIDGKPMEDADTLAEAIVAVNGATSTAVLKLKKGMTLDEALEFTTEATVILDFAGLVLTNDLGVAAITNSAAYLITTNSVGNGGITGISSGSSAIYQFDNNGQLDVYGGEFRADIEGFGANLLIAGGSFQQEADAFAWEDPATHKVFSLIADGKALQYNSETGLYDVVDIVYYTVGFYDDVQGEGSLIGTEASVAAGTLATAPAAPTKTGYTFVDWTPSTNAAITANTNFYPTWSANSYTITYYDGENVLDLAPASYTYGTGVNLPASADTKTGYTFDGWYDNAGLTGDPVTAVAASETGNQTFYAKYTANTYTVTFYTNSVEYATATYTYGNAGSYNAPADPSVSGYTFGGWYTDNGTFKSAFVFSATAGADQNVYAKLTEDAPVVPTIDPASDTAVVPVQEGETAEQAAARVEVGISSDVAAALTSAGVSESTYQGYFSKTAVKDGDNWNVTAEFTDTVETAVATAAEAVVNGTATTVTIPAGLYYKVTTYTALGGTPTVAISSTLSTGAPSATISKPGDTQGFIKIELDTAPIK